MLPIVPNPDYLEKKYSFFVSTVQKQVRHNSRLYNYCTLTKQLMLNLIS